jgi:hypothetical protein
MAAQWPDDDRQTRIVRLGSGSGSLLTCVLAHHDLNFVRLLATGYPQICWIDEFVAPPQPWTRTLTAGFPRTAGVAAARPIHHLPATAARRASTGIRDKGGRAPLPKQADK